MTELRISVDGEWEPVEPSLPDEQEVTDPEIEAQAKQWAKEIMERGRAAGVVPWEAPIVTSDDLKVEGRIFAYNRLRRRLKVTLD